MQYSRIEIDAYRLLLHVGHSDAERLARQPIDIAFKIRFTDAPAACRTDELYDTICYDLLCQDIRARCWEKEFKLLEHLGAAVHESLSRSAGPKAQVWVSVAKARPILADVGRIRFSCGDFDA